MNGMRGAFHSLRKVGIAVMWICTGSCGAQATTAPMPGVISAPAKASILSQAASAIRMKQCLEVAQRLSPLVSTGSGGQDLILDWDKAQPRDGPVFSLVGVEYANATVAVLLSAFPEADGSCTFAAERVSVAPFTCESVAKSELPGYSAVQLLSHFSVFMDPKDPAATVALLDSPPGCLIIRRHVQFRWRADGAAPLGTPP